MNVAKLAILALLFIQSPYSYSQNSLSGKVTDATDHSGIKSVSVFIPELQKGTVSDDDGAFFFENLPSKSILIQFSSIGFKSVVKTVDLSKVSRIDAELVPSVWELEAVLITSSNTKLPDNIPFSVNSISQNEVRKYGSPSLMGNLSYEPGIDKISIGNGIAKPVIRGLSFNQIMLYGQGTRIENQQWDDHHDLGLSDIGVEKIELVRGPAALIYGADAMGGALIFVDEKPAPLGTTVGDINFGFGSNTLGLNGDAGLKGTGKSGFFYGVRIGGNSQTSYLQGEGEEENKLTKEEEEFAPNSKFLSSTVKANIGISKNWGLSKLSYSILNQQIGIIEDEAADSTKTKSEEEEQREREVEAPYQDVNSQIISSENTVFVGNSKINLNLAYQINKRKEFEPLPDKQKELAIGLNLNVTTYDIKWTSNQEKNFGLSLGSQGTFLKNENNGKESLVPNADVNDIAGYGLLRYDLNKLNILGGIRIDKRKIEVESYELSAGFEEDTLIMLHTGDTIPENETDFEKEYTPVSFSLGAAYHIYENLTVKLNIATGFTAPNYAQLSTFGKHEGTFRFERGNEDLKIEQNKEGDLGLVWENDFSTISLGGYINNVQNYIYLINTGDSIVKATADGRDTFPIYEYKQGDASLTGGEFSIGIHPTTTKWVELKATYAIIKGTLDNGGNLPYIPSNKLVAEIKFKLNKLWNFTDSYLSFVGSKYEKRKNVAQYEVSSDGYTLLDAYLGASFKLGKQKATFNIYCTNLLNKEYYNQLSLVKAIGIHDMGRNIGIQLHVPIGFNKI